MKMEDLKDIRKEITKIDNEMAISHLCGDVPQTIPCHRKTS